MRKYKVQFDVSTANVGAVIGTLVSEVEPPSVTPCGEGMFRVTFLAMQGQLPTIFSVVDEAAEKIHVVPFVETVSEAVRPFLPKPGVPYIPPGTPVTVARPVRVLGRTLIDVITDYLKEHAEGVQMGNLEDYAAARGYSRKSVSPTLAGLRNSGTLEPANNHGLVKLRRAQ